MVFYGRNQELKLLRQMSKKDCSTISVVYGRRRIGKSSLIREAFKDKSVIYFEGLENASKKNQLETFFLQLRYQIPNIKIEEKPRRWSEAFLLLNRVINKKEYIVVFDEFQWMANYHSLIVSELKMAWDSFLSTSSKITLILCGSIASFMIKKVLKSKALYGRCDLEIHLMPFSLLETKMILDNFENDLIVESYLLVGGVPKYLQLLRGFSSPYLAIQKEAFQLGGYLVGEYEKIFTSHFGNNQNYEKIINILSENPYGISRINLAKKLGIKLGGTLSLLLYNLEKAGFISFLLPFDKDVNSRQIKYMLTDLFLRFYNQFIKKNLKKIINGKENIFIDITQTSAYHSFKGRSFELLCYNHAKKISKVLGFSEIDYNYGPYFKLTGNDQTQIDLLFQRADNIISLCEIKFKERPIGTEVIEDVEKKVSLIREKYKCTIQKILITKSKPTRELINKNYFYKIILPEELI